MTYNINYKSGLRWHMVYDNKSVHLVKIYHTEIWIHFKCFASYVIHCQVRYSFAGTLFIARYVIHCQVRYSLSGTLRQFLRSKAFYIDLNIVYRCISSLSSMWEFHLYHLRLISHATFPHESIHIFNTLIYPHVTKSASNSFSVTFVTQFLYFYWPGHVAYNKLCQAIFVSSIRVSFSQIECIRQ